MSKPMKSKWVRLTATVAVAGALGTVLRLGLVAGLGHEMVALAAVNILAWSLMGLVSGRYGSRLRHLRLFMVVLGITGFTSCMSLIIDGSTTAGEGLAALFEVFLGLAFAGIGHLFTMRRGPDL